jgi:tetratricopeptide (TPR) repeat protein
MQLLLRRLKRYPEAQRYAMRAISSAEKRFGLAHPSLLTRYGNLARIYALQNKAEQACSSLQKTLAVRALSVQENKLEADNLLHAKNDLLVAEVLQLIGDKQNALKFVGRARDDFVRLSEPDPYWLKQVDKVQAELLERAPVRSCALVFERPEQIPLKQRD